MDEMSVDVEENSRIIFFVYYMVLEDFVVESAGNRISRRHDFGILVVCVAEKDGRISIFVQSSIYAPLTSITAQCQKKIVCRVAKVDADETPAGIGAFSMLLNVHGSELPMHSPILRSRRNDFDFYL